jgi:hypothetical protein
MQKSYNTVYSAYKKFTTSKDICESDTMERIKLPITKVFTSRTATPAKQLPILRQFFVVKAIPLPAYNDVNNTVHRKN